MRPREPDLYSIDVVTVGSLILRPGGPCKIHAGSDCNFLGPRDETFKLKCFYEPETRGGRDPTYILPGVVVDVLWMAPEKA